MKRMVLLFVLVGSVWAQILYNPHEAGVPLLKTERGVCIAVKNGTPVQILGGPYTVEEVLGRGSAVELPGIYKVKILEGKCKGTIGYVLGTHLK